MLHWQPKLIWITTFYTLCFKCIGDFFFFVYESACRIEKSELAADPPYKLMNMRTLLLHIACKIVFVGEWACEHCLTHTHLWVWALGPWGLLWYRTLQHLAGHGRAEDVCCQRETLGNSLTPSIHGGVAGGVTNTFLLPKQHIQQEVSAMWVLPSCEFLRNAVFRLLPETSGDYNLINFHGKPREL